MAVSSTNSTSSWSSMFGIKNNGIGGLATGLDTESLVKALTSGTQLKITKQQQQRQLLTWRQDNYRSVITALSAFQKKSFQTSSSSTASSNILHTSFFSTYKSTSSSDKISVSAGSGATLGEIKIDDITQMATAQSLKSKDMGNLEVAFRDDLATAEYDSKTAFTGQTVKMQFNGTSKTIKLDELNSTLIANGNGKYSFDTTQFKSKMQEILDKNFAKTKGNESNVAVKEVNGKFVLESNTGWLTIESSNQQLGLVGGNSNHLLVSNTLADMENNFSSQFKLQGNTLTFSINDTMFTVDRNTSIKDLVGKINSSDANVRVEYNGNSGRFTMTSKTTGGADNLVIKDISGNLMNQLFGAQGGGSLTSASLIKSSAVVSNNINPWAAATDKAALQSLAKSYKTFDITINGVTKAVKVNLSTIDSDKLKAGTYTQDEYIGAINSSINYTFGSDEVTFKADASGKLEVVTKSASTSVTLGQGAGTIGFSEGQSNYVSDVNYNGTISLGAMSLTKNQLTGLYEMPSGGNNTINVEIVGENGWTTQLGLALDFSTLDGVKAGSAEAKKALDAINANIASQLNNLGVDADKIDLKLADPFEIHFTQQVLESKDGNNTKLEVYKEQQSVTDNGKTYYEFSDENGKTVYGDGTDFYTKDSSGYNKVAAADQQKYTDQLRNGTMKRVATDKTVYVDTLTKKVYSDLNGTEIAGKTYDKSQTNAGYVSVLAGQQTTKTINGTEYKGYIDTSNKNAEYFQDKNGNFFTYDANTNQMTAINASNSPNVTNLNVMYDYTLKQSVSLSLGVSNQAKVTITPDNVAGGGAFFNAIGFSGNSVTNYSSNTETKLSDIAAGINLNGVLTFSDMTGASSVTVNYRSDMKLRDFIDQIKTQTNGDITASVVNGQLSITSVSGEINVSDSGSMLKNLFGLDTNTYKTEAKTADFKNNMTDGKNMEIVMNGQTFSYATNSITVDGVNITVNGENTGPITINTVSDATDTLERIKTWMDDYNALVHTLNQTVTETRPKSNGSLYEPLTDDQKAEMSESEITKWETEAKKGLLHNDSAIKNVLSQMRQALYEKVEAAGLSLWDLGIQTVNSLDPLEHGKLEFTSGDYSKSGTKGEDRLRQLLETEPDRVRAFFQGADGLGNKLNDIITNAASTSSVNRGTLVKIAGTTISTGDNTSTLGNKMDEIDKYIANLKLRLESEYNRYWKNFTALETAVSKMNSQSSWLQSNA